MWLYLKLILSFQKQRDTFVVIGLVYSHGLLSPWFSIGNIVLFCVHFGWCTFLILICEMLKLSLSGTWMHLVALRINLQKIFKFFEWNDR